MPPQLSSAQAKIYQQRGKCLRVQGFGRKEQRTSLSTSIKVWHSPLLRLSIKEDLAGNLFAWLWVRWEDGDHEGPLEEDPTCRGEREQEHNTPNTSLSSGEVRVGVQNKLKKKLSPGEVRVGFKNHWQFREATVASYQRLFLPPSRKANREEYPTCRGETEQETNTPDTSLSSGEVRASAKDKVQTKLSPGEVRAGSKNHWQFKEATVASH
uniref:Uncharacterized protein n=1 Tax=Pogona vitticeps TaxID=103695 RepID=A0ABM5FM96_9SAUR